MTSPRPLPQAEYEARTAAAQALMATAGLDALLVTTEADFRYFTGFLTRFWESPTRPWFAIIPAAGAPVAVIPAIGAALMATTWIADIRTWPAPDPEDDGVSLLAASLREIAGPRGRIGTPMGQGSHLRMPLADWARLGEAIAPARIGSDAGALQTLRMVKSPAEIALIRASCAVADRAFARTGEIAREGVPLDAVFRDFQILCLEEGADAVPYLAGAAGQGGYGDVISPATDAPLARGDVLMLDTGVSRAGYFCDFDRNFAVGAPGPEIAAAHERLIDATSAGFEAARPGATAADLHEAMRRVLGADARFAAASGRFGHGVGMQLTEPPSILPGEEATLRPGMAMTLEPVIDIAPGRLMVHEENIVITETGAEWLTTPAPRAIPVLEA